MLRRPRRSRPLLIPVLCIALGLGILLAGGDGVHAAIVSGDAGAFLLATHVAFALMGLGVVGLGLRTYRDSRRDARPPGEGPIRLARHDPGGGSYLVLHGGFALGFGAATSLLASVPAEPGSIAMLVVFGALALGLVISFLFRILSRISPRVDVTVDGPARLGQKVSFTIRLLGLTPIKYARARLVAREEAAHTVGTKTLTDTATAFDEPIGESTERTRVITLNHHLPLSRKGVPTFHAERNHVRWLVVIEAVAALWPVVCLEYELEVWPAEARRG